MTKPRNDFILTMPSGSLKCIKICCRLNQPMLSSIQEKSLLHDSMLVSHVKNPFTLAFNKFFFIHIFFFIYFLSKTATSPDLYALYKIIDNLKTLYSRWRKYLFYNKLSTNYSPNCPQKYFSLLYIYQFQLEPF